MPTSRPIAINYICDRILELNPRAILDVGIGFGKFGFLAREYTDVWHGNYFKWKTRIDGIEAFEPYVGDLQRAIYDNIYLGEALELLEGIEKRRYDLIICSDMLEHVLKVQGMRILGEMKRVSANSIVVLPVMPSPQVDVYENEYERHRAIWSSNELIAFGHLSIMGNRMFILEMKGGK